MPHQAESDVLVGADGLWSEVRSQVCRDGPPQPTGHLAYRTLAVQSDLPAALRSQDVTVWLGPRMHVVAYPVKAGEQLNVVAIVQGDAPRGPRTTGTRPERSAELLAAMGPLCQPLQDLVRAMPSWRLWALQDRPPMQSADEMASGRVALLGDAAHPMRPYLAQGAGMAIEDAAELGHALATAKGPAQRCGDGPARLRAEPLGALRPGAGAVRSATAASSTPPAWCAGVATCRCVCSASACWTSPGCTSASAASG